jgi:hypothetical protein
MTLNKKNFLITLKNISNILDKKEIKHDLPFCHIDKQIFNHMFIIIPDYVTVFDIADYFNCVGIKEKNGIIRTIIDDIVINFVKTRENEWNYTFYYYSWNIIHTFVDILMSKSFNLRYTRKGLIYLYKEKYINVSINMKNIIEFLDLKLHPIMNGFPSENSIFKFIESSPYYDTNYFTLENFKKYDPDYDLNEQYYINFLKNKSKYVGEKKTLNEQLNYIDIIFPNSKFIEKISKIEIKNEYPNIKKAPIIIKPDKKSIDDMVNEVTKKRIKKNKKIKKINLKKIVDNKDDNDFNFKII